MAKEFSQLPRLALPNLAKNARFLVSCTGHFLPVRFLKKVLGKRYPYFGSTRPDICIEGMQRSGNTFFVAVFRRWNSSAQIVHHTHLASSVKEALASGVPTAVLVRRPEEAVASIIAWDSRLSVTAALVSYILFYRTLWKHAQSFTVLLFEDVVSDPGGCISKINQHSGTDFSHAPVSSAFREDVIRTIKSNDQIMNRNQLSSSLPHPEKTELKTRIKPLVEANWLYMPATSWYRKYQELADRPESQVLHEHLGRRD